jgi:hypothetical protein
MKKARLILSVQSSHADSRRCFVTAAKYGQRSVPRVLVDAETARTSEQEHSKRQWAVKHARRILMDKGYWLTDADEVAAQHFVSGNLDTVKLFGVRIGGPISEDERARRMDAVRYARASVELEGFQLNVEYEAHTKRYVNGHMSLDEWLAIPPRVP